MDILPHMEGEKGINNFNDRVCGNSQRNTFWQIIGVFSFLILPKKLIRKLMYFWKNTRLWLQCTSLCVTSHQCWSLSWLIKHWTHSGIGWECTRHQATKDTQISYQHTWGASAILTFIIYVQSRINPGSSSSPKPRFLSQLGLNKVDP